MLRNLINISACAFLLGMVACSKETAGITEEGNPVADNTQYKYDLWNGANGSARVNMGDGVTGYWYVESSPVLGRSSITFPVSVEEDDSPDAMESVVSYCGGVCGTVELGEGSDVSTGVGIALVEKDTAIDVSGWDGLCVSYESELSMKGLLGYKDGDAEASAEDMPSVNFEKTTKGSVAARCAKWAEFQNGSSAEVAKKVTSLIFKFMGKSKESGFFNIKGVSSYKHGIVKIDSLEQDSCLWNAAPKNDGDSLITGYDGLEGGSWYEFNDQEEGGLSSLEWDVLPSNYMSVSVWVADVVKSKGGLSATVNLQKNNNEEAFAGIGLQIIGYDEESEDFYPKPRDVSAWGGLCVTYMSEMDARLVLVADSAHEASATLPMSTSPIEKCLTWEEMSAQEVAKNASLIEFELRSSVDTTAGLSVIAVGKYSPTGTCKIDVSKVTLFPVNE